MKVKLLQNVIDPRTNKVKVVEKGTVMSKDKDGDLVINPKRTISFYAGTVIEASEETGKKWIQQGKAKKVA